MAAMIAMRLRQVQQGFFDRQAVVSAMSRQAGKALSRFGAFVRRRDQTSQRRRPGTSAPGSPPRAHLGYVRDFTFFAYDAEQQSVIIGPILLNRANPRALVTLEQGGDEEITIKGKRVRAHYPARPHTRPAFDEELRRLPGLLQG